MSINVTGMANVTGLWVNPDTREVFTVKTSKRGNDYFSTITSQRRIKRALKAFDALIAEEAVK